VTGRRAADPSEYPALLFDAYRSTVRRAPSHALLEPARALAGTPGPGPLLVATVPEDADLTRNAGTGGVAIGERIIVTGRVMDERGVAAPDVLIEIWQANAAGRYIHERDRHDAPLDPNFLGIGTCRTDAEGRYRFQSVRPGAYPWKNDPNAWRPSHIHFSLLGPTFASRLITQMYFPGDPLHEFDPILTSIPSPLARARLIAAYDHSVTEPEWALGYRWDIVLAGTEATPFEGPADPDA
jgi:protocatechuate 3,4-dioxygenase beta subunit